MNYDADAVNKVQYNLGAYPFASSLYRRGRE